VLKEGHTNSQHGELINLLSFTKKMGKSVTHSRITIPKHKIFCVGHYPSGIFNHSMLTTKQRNQETNILYKIWMQFISIQHFFQSLPSLKRTQQIHEHLRITVPDFRR
jgi:hypothetical protein